MSITLFRSRLFLLCLVVQSVIALSPTFALAQHTPAAPKTALSIRFIDSATGYSIQPDSVTARAHQPGRPEFRASASAFPKHGRASLDLERGRHTVTVVSSRHMPVSGEVEVAENSPYKIQFLLDPTEEPAELNPEYIATLRRDDAMLVQGFIVDEDSGEPLGGVRVSSSPSGVETLSDTRGFFQFYIPVQTEVEAGALSATLLFEKKGYKDEERQHLELWPKGDTTYKIRLVQGNGIQTVDERTLRRRAPAGVTTAWAIPREKTQNLWPEPILEPLLSSSGSGPVFATASSNATVRVPRNIRVMRSDNVTIDYVSLTYYSRAVLGSEWIASWGSYTGGSNSLNAGAVAVRCYAIARINNATSASTFDICATTSCQVYNPANIHALTDTAVNYTLNWVLLSSPGGSISSTEYSAENNSITFSCGDGFTQPTGGCLYDPACVGETRFGHGRGMCQWGTARWATGRRMAGRSSGDATSNGFARRDWKWIVQHYYPTLTFVKGASLVTGDDVKALKTLDVRACPDGGITNGTSCGLVTTKAAGATGVIIGGPVVVTNDARGFTWYQVQWNDGVPTIGWSAENYLERVYSTPGAPTSLAATAVATNQINLTWTDATAVESGYEIERAPASTGPWIQIGTTAANGSIYSDKNLYPGSTWHYRVNAYNAAGASAYTGVASATTPPAPPVLAVIPNRTIAEGATLSFTASAVAPDRVQLITDFDAFMSETANGVVVFREPRFSGSTVSLIDAVPSLAVVTDSYRTNGHGTSTVLRVSCNFTNASNPWLRLTTAGTATLPNPVIDFTKKLRFDLYADKPVQVAIGCREASVAAGTAIGANGGATGGIEWVGASGMAGTAPIATRSISASNWTTLTFQFANEPIYNFSGGNGVLSTASGLGVLEHVAVVPAGGLGTYNVYVDNLAVLTPRTVTYGLGPGAPAGATIHPATGAFSWAPGEAQGPGTNLISIIAMDDSVPPLSSTNTFSVVAAEVNTAPVLSAIPEHTVHAGAAVVFTNSATDSDLPANAFSFTLDPGAPPGAVVDATSGVFTWLTSDLFAGTTNLITVRVADNGTPALSDAKSFAVAVLSRPALQLISGPAGGSMIQWSSIPGTTYRVQYKDNLMSETWTDLLPDIVAADFTAAITNHSESAQRFYRIQSLNQ